MWIENEILAAFPLGVVAKPRGPAQPGDAIEPEGLADPLVEEQAQIPVQGVTNVISHQRLQALDARAARQHALEFVLFERAEDQSELGLALPGACTQNRADPQCAGESGARDAPAGLVLQGRPFAREFFQIGGQASVAAGPVGSTIGANTDFKKGSAIYSYSTKGAGLFAGVSLAGSDVRVDDKGNRTAYPEGSVPVKSDKSPDVAALLKTQAEAKNTPAIVQPFTAALNKRIGGAR